MSWKRFWDWLFRRPPPGDDPLASLRKLARDQGRSLDEVTYELLAHSQVRKTAAFRPGPLWKELTPREQDVAALIYVGYSNSEIAYLLGLGLETVRSHIQRMLRKCNLHSKAELCIALRSEGAEPVILQRLEALLDPPPPPGVRG
jgi:DNA-binding NarL/FixJ family response regulator